MDDRMGHTAPAKPRILFVEDEMTVREHLAGVLSDEYVVDTAGNGEEALLALLRARPDLVVADIVMPGLDGVELVRMLRNRPSTQTIPVLLTSGRAPEELRIEGFEHGADGYLAKPYTERELRARISALLQAARVRREAVHREALELAERRVLSERAALLESITDAFYALDRQWRFTYVNQRALDYYGTSREELLGKVVWDMFPMAKGTIFEHEYRRAVREQRAVTFEVLSPFSDRWVEIHAYPSPQGLAVNFRDITERRLAEEERQAALARVRDREWRLELATDIAGLGIFVWHVRTDQVVSENARSYVIFGRTPGDPNLSRQDVFERFVHPEDRASLEQLLKESMESGTPLRATCRIRRQNDGASRWIEIAGSIELGVDGAPERLLGVLRDITERRRAEQAVRDNEARFRTLAEAVPALVFESNAAGANTYTNAQFQTYTGLPPEKLLGDGWLDVLHPGDRDRAAEVWARAVASGGPYEAEYRFRSYDGSYRWFLVRGHALHDDNGSVTTWYGTCTDIDDAKRTAEALSASERRKDEFLAVLAHELRNPLAPIRNGLQIARLRASTDATLQGVVNMMDRQMSHMVRLVDDLLDVSRITSGKLELRRQKVRLTDVLANAVDATRVFIEAHGHELVIEVRTEGLTVDGDPERLAQVFANLLSNSAKYTDRGGRITLTLDNDGDAAVIKVQDTGIGIPGEALGRVFNMFTQIGAHQQRAPGGLGIGLSLVKTLVEMHEGSVTAHSDGPGHGSAFTVRLPLAEMSMSEMRASSSEAFLPTTPSQSQVKRILVVDDNTDAAASLAMLLEIEGYEVATAADGQEAVARTIDFQPSIIFMDIGMPHVDGYEATRRIRTLPQGERAFIVALTGWGQDADRHRSREAGMNHHLVKPVSLDAINEVLAAAAGLECADNAAVSLRHT